MNFVSAESLESGFRTLARFRSSLVRPRGEAIDDDSEALVGCTDDDDRMPFRVGRKKMLNALTHVLTLSLPVSVSLTHFNFNTHTLDTLVRKCVFVVVRLGERERVCEGGKSACNESESGSQLRRKSCLPNDSNTFVVV